MTKAQQQTSTDAAVTWQLTACWLQLKRPASAIDSAQQLLLVPGYRGRAHLQLAAAYRQLDDLQNVSRHLELALSEKGEPLPLSEREIRLSAAEALLIAGRARRALKVLQEGPATDTDMQLHSIHDMQAPWNHWRKSSCNRNCLPPPWSCCCRWLSRRARLPLRPFCCSVLIRTCGISPRRIAGNGK